MSTIVRIHEIGKTLYKIAREGLSENIFVKNSGKAMIGAIINRQQSTEISKVFKIHGNRASGDYNRTKAVYGCLYKYVGKTENIFLRLLQNL